MDLNRWARAYQKAAKADHYALLRDHLARLELPDEPGLLLAGTMDVVVACLAYHQLDGQSSAGFLAMQTYDPADSPGTPYSYTFNLCDRAYARVLVSTLKGGQSLDLADLYGHPWQDYQVVGYRDILVSRNDGRKLSRREMARIEKEVTYDLRYDYCEDEISLNFIGDYIPGVLRVDVQDVEPLDDEEQAK